MIFLPLISPEPIPYTPLEAQALIFQMKYTKAEYQHQIDEGKKRNFDVYPPYKEVRNYAKQNLRPDGMIFSENEAMCPLQNLADWQLGKRLGLKSSAPILDRMSVLANDGWSFEHLIKDGGDGFSDNPEYQSESDHPQTSIFATVGLSCHLRAVKKTANVILMEELWKNEFINSWHAIFPIRYGFEKEDTSMK